MHYFILPYRVKLFSGAGFMMTGAVSYMKIKIILKFTRLRSIRSSLVFDKSSSGCWRNAARLYTLLPRKLRHVFSRLNILVFDILPKREL